MYIWEHLGTSRTILYHHPFEFHIEQLKNTQTNLWDNLISSIHLRTLGHLDHCSQCNVCYISLFSTPESKCRKRNHLVDDIMAFRAFWNTQWATYFGTDAIIGHLFDILWSQEILIGLGKSQETTNTICWYWFLGSVFPPEFTENHSLKLFKLNKGKKGMKKKKQFSLCISTQKSGLWQVLEKHFKNCKAALSPGRPCNPGLSWPVCFSF